MKQHLKAIYCVGIALAWAIQKVDASETYKFDQAHSTIGFRVHQFVSTARGKFNQFSGTIILDRDHPERSSVSARIQAGSIDTGISKRDDHLRSEEFFNVAKYPEITFKSRNVTRTGTEAGDITGDLTMHGVTKSVTLHVKLVTPLSETGRTRWEITSEPLKRREFGLMFSRGAEAVSGISQEVEIRFEIEAKRAE